MSQPGAGAEHTPSHNTAADLPEQLRANIANVLAWATPIGQTEPGRPARTRHTRINRDDRTVGYELRLHTGSPSDTVPVDAYLGNGRLVLFHQLLPEERDGIDAQLADLQHGHGVMTARFWSMHPITFEPVTIDVTEIRTRGGVPGIVDHTVTVYGGEHPPYVLPEHIKNSRMANFWLSNVTEPPMLFNPYDSVTTVEDVSYFLAEGQPPTQPA